MRLNTFIAHNSAHSRREADSLIAQGRVRINRQKAQLGAMITKDDKIFIDGKQLKPKKADDYTFIIYHKPKGELVSKRDDRARRVIYDSLESRFRAFIPVGRLDFASEGLLILGDSPKGELVSKRDDRARRVIYDSLESRFRAFIPVGRLDFASEGLLILGDSKSIVSALMHSNLEREYIIKIDKPITQAMLEAMENGLKASDARRGGHSHSEIVAMEFAPFISWQIIKSTPTLSRLKVVIQEGRNRELRRFFGYFKASVLDLRRVRYGFARLNALPVGKWRYFSKDEYKSLRAFLKDSHPNV